MIISAEQVAKSMQALKEQQIAQCMEDLRKLRGLPPYDTFTNICYGDGYFAGSIERNWTAEVRAAARKAIAKEQKAWNKIRAAFIKYKGNTGQ